MPSKIPFPTVLLAKGREGFVFFCEYFITFHFK